MLYALPGTFAVYSANSSAERFRAVLTATDDANATLIVRSAVMSLVPEKTLFVRLGLVSACEGAAGQCGPGQTCIEGRCQSEDVDSSQLPAYVTGFEGRVECTSPTNFIDTSTRQPLKISGTSCGAGSCLEGICLIPPRDGEIGGASGGAGTSGGGGASGSGAIDTGAGGGVAGAGGAAGARGVAGAGGAAGAGAAAGAGGAAGAGTAGAAGRGAGGAGGATVVNSCTSTTGQGTLTQQNQTGVVTCDSKEYIVFNSETATTGQQLTYGPGPTFRVQLQNNTGTTTQPAGVPSVFTGANSGNTTGSTSMLPRAVSQIAAGSLATTLTWTNNGVNGTYATINDLWFSTSAQGDPTAPAPSGGDLMIWLTPVTSLPPTGSAVATASIGGRQWNVWYGTNQRTGKPCVTYAPQAAITSISYTLGDFVQDAVSRNDVMSTWYLTNVFGEFEIVTGGAGLAITNFSVNVP